VLHLSLLANLVWVTLHVMEIFGTDSKCYYDFEANTWNYGASSI